MSAAGPRRGRPRERAEGQARRARPRARAAADARRFSMWHAYKEAAWNCAPPGGSAAAELANEAASVGAL